MHLRFGFDAGRCLPAVRFVLGFLVLLPVCRAEPGASPALRPRVMILSDFPPLDVVPGGLGRGAPEKRSDPDDLQSMVRLLLYTNDLEIEGLIASSGTLANVANKQHLLDLVEVYDQVDENLRLRDGRYPTADALRSVVSQGRSGTWGKAVDEVIGAGKDSEASEAIIRAVDRPDPRPVWVSVWGGPAELAQALWKVRQTRTPEALATFVRKLRVFMIGLGDKPGQDGSGQWMLDTFPDLFVVVSQATYTGMFAQGSPLGNSEWLNAHIREGHGPLGALYPPSGYEPRSPGMQEGDTPAFLHLVSASRGINDPEQPEQGGWGGQYVRRDSSKRHWYDGPGPESIRKWLPDIQADFARRAEWMLPPSGAGIGLRGVADSNPRIVVTTDLGADPDDEQSLVRLLVSANEFDIEGLVVSTSCWKRTQNDTVKLDRILEAYGKVFPNLSVHAKGFPTLARLKAVSALGQRGYGMEDVGEGKDSAGAQLIIDAADRPDPRPVWVQLWGGGNTLAQAIWRVRATRSPEAFAEFLGKLRIFDILGQDDAGAWIARNFPQVLYIRATGVYGWAPTDQYLDSQVQCHGPLGAVYPDRQWATEGDTPAFMHVFPNGLNDPEALNQGGWGGRFETSRSAGIRSMSEVAKISASAESRFDPYLMHGNTGEGAEAIKRWRPDYDNDFAARMLWSVTPAYAGANHHPVAVVNGDTSRRVLRVDAAPGDVVRLSAEESFDADGDALSYAWSVYAEASSYQGDVRLDGATAVASVLSIPTDASGKSLHVVLRLTDAGRPALTAYRRVVITVR